MLFVICGNINYTNLNIEIFDMVINKKSLYIVYAIYGSF